MLWILCYGDCGSDVAGIQARQQVGADRWVVDDDEIVLLVVAAFMEMVEECRKRNASKN